MKVTGGNPEKIAVTFFWPTVEPSVHTVLAKPFGSVTTLVGLTLPPPAPTTQVMGLPPTPLPLSSSRRTTRGLASTDPMPPFWASPETRTSAVGLAGSAVCVKLTGVSPAEEAWACWLPDELPSTRSAAARPFASVTMVSGLIEPPPVTVQSTCTPAAGLPSASVTRTTSESGSAEPTAAVWLSPLAISSSAPAPDMAEALKVTTSPAGRWSPWTVASTRCCPAPPPSVQLLAASPSDPVKVLPGVTLPPPASTAKVMD